MPFALPVTFKEALISLTPQVPRFNVIQNLSQMVECAIDHSPTDLIA